MPVFVPAPTPPSKEYGHKKYLDGSVYCSGCRKRYYEHEFTQKLFRNKANSLICKTCRQRVRVKPKRAVEDQRRSYNEFMTGKFVAQQPTTKS